VSDTITLRPIGWIRSELADVDTAPKQGDEGAPEAWIDYDPDLARGFADLAPGDDVFILTWLDRARRDVLWVHPRGDARNPETGVFSTRSPHRPNPIGIHPVTVTRTRPGSIRVGPIEAVDGTPVLDVKPVLGPPSSR
jgi:tRNA-Thr(GGU) m(6)t(6)A37 methyltransferase TsaA